MAPSFSCNSLLPVFLLVTALLFSAAGFAEKGAQAVSIESIAKLKSEKEPPVVGETIRLSQKQNARACHVAISAGVTVSRNLYHTSTATLWWQIPDHGTFLFLHMLKLF